MKRRLTQIAVVVISMPCNQFGGGGGGRGHSLAKFYSSAQTFLCIHIYIYICV